MGRDEPARLERHRPAKIKDAEDLLSVTRGFPRRRPCLRLPRYALRLETRPTTSLPAQSSRINGGQIARVEDAGTPLGTPSPSATLLQYLLRARSA